MPLLKDGKITADTWTNVADEDALEAGTPSIVSLDRWLAESDRLSGHDAPLGIRLRNDQSPAQVVEDLSRFDVVVLHFPAFVDGRAYSGARLLRERYGYKGEIRATGDVLRDQYALMLRCGFDAFEVADDIDVEAWRDSAESISGAYQNAADGVQAIWALRHGVRKADAA